MQDPDLPPGCRQSDIDDPEEERRRPADPLEQLAEFFAENSRPAGSLVPGKANRFVADFLAEYGEDLVDELFGTTSLQWVGERYQQKLIEFAASEGIIDSDVPLRKPSKRPSPSASARRPDEAQGRAAS